MSDTTNPALASACAAIRALAVEYGTVSPSGDAAISDAEFDAALTALVASWLPPSDATVTQVCECGHDHRTAWDLEGDLSWCLDDDCACESFAPTRRRVTYTEEIGWSDG